MPDGENYQIKLFSNFDAPLLPIPTSFHEMNWQSCHALTGVRIFSTLVAFRIIRDPLHLVSRANKRSLRHVVRVQAIHSVGEKT
jgi:hypothetical protein